MVLQGNVFSILILVLIGFSIWIFLKSETKKELFYKRVKVALRAVGHQLLLSNKDSSSLVLPVKKITENKFQISFEKHLYIEPNILVEVVKNAFEKSDFSKNYFVEVLQCASNDVVYSYKIKNESEKNIIPCKGRVLPVDCYLVEIVFTEIKTSVLNPFFQLLILIVFCFGFFLF